MTRASPVNRAHMNSPLEGKVHVPFFNVFPKTSFFICRKEPWNTLGTSDAYLQKFFKNGQISCQRGQSHFLKCNGSTDFKLVLNL